MATASAMTAIPNAQWQIHGSKRYLNLRRAYACGRARLTGSYTDEPKIGGERLKAMNRNWIFLKTNIIGVFKRQIYFSSKVKPFIIKTQASASGVAERPD
jgi:hypothetical protein